MTAVIATVKGFPASRSRLSKAARSRFYRTATTAVLWSMLRAATSAASVFPSSIVAGSSVAAVVGPIPGIDVRIAERRTIVRSDRMSSKALRCFRKSALRSAN